ncbi:MAG: beta-lactamase family protein [Cytophagaceae bacterium]|nr:beta-lactamase family protein [Gemmatimonadaceae bacterium]
MTTAPRLLWTGSVARMGRVVILALALSTRLVAAQEPVSAQTLKAALDSLRTTARFPGATLGISLPGGISLGVASGFSDTVRKVPMQATDRLLQGSVGKTYVAAIALQLVQEGTLSLDDPIAKYLGSEPWFTRLPNSARITVRHLMQHTSGLVRWEFDPAAAAVMRAHPFKVWTPVERLGYLFDKPAPFEAGAGWEYSDTNYIVLGMIIERITGRTYYDELHRRLLRPLHLVNTIPSDRRRLEKVVNGYAGPRNDLGGFDASLVDGMLAVNPQLEWTGGGVASTSQELAHWLRILFTGRVIPQPLLDQMVAGVPARLGANVRYGLGMMIRDTPLGPAWGHSGFFPGYATEALYFPELDMAVAIQVNVTDPYPRGLVPFLIHVAGIVPSTKR